MTSIVAEINRDSINLADDMHDHIKVIGMDMQHDISTTIYNIAVWYLPEIAGRNHSWMCLFNGESVGIINGNCAKVTMLCKELKILSENKLYFKYHAAID